MKRIYRQKDSWILCTCTECKGEPALNYVEPHGTTAFCQKCRRETEHVNIPYSRRDSSGTWLVNR